MCRKYGLKPVDAIVASTAIRMKLPLATADKAFKKIKDLDLIFYDFEKRKIG